MHSVRNKEGWDLSFNEDLSGRAVVHRQGINTHFPADLLQKLIDWKLTQPSDEPDDSTIYDEPRHHPTCGTLYRGCHPQCPVCWHDKGKQEGVDLVYARVKKLMAEEPTP